MHKIKKMINEYVQYLQYEYLNEKMKERMDKESPASVVVPMSVALFDP